MKNAVVFSLILSGLLVASLVQADTVDDLLTEYRAQGAGPFNAASGNTIWSREFPSKEGANRSCTGCHTSDPLMQGRHATTGKAIDALAPSANATRLTDRRQVEKWLKRNCKWTLGRECTPQQKGDLLSFLRTQ